jgi:hypothetical protein
MMGTYDHPLPTSHEIKVTGILGETGKMEHKQMVLIPQYY